MSTITTKDGTQIYYKDWGQGRAIVFHHGWPLTCDDLDAQMLFFLQQGLPRHRDRPAHGRSSQASDGHDMDHYAADAAAVVEHLDPRNAIHIGHSTGGGEVTRYVARHGKGRLAKVVLMSAVPPIMVKTPRHPGGLPVEVFDGLRNSLAANRTQVYRDVASGPFYGFNRPGAKPQESVVANWWRQGMMGGANAHYDGIKAFSETDLTEDLQNIDAPTLVMHGDDDQIVPYKNAALLSVKLLRKATLKTRLSGISRRSHIPVTQPRAGVTLSGAGSTVWSEAPEALLPSNALISIVDDDDSVREALKGLMKSLGYAVEVFASALDFLASPHLKNTACLIADIHMPAMTGVELYDRLMGAGSRIPTILITAYSDDAVRARTMKDGVVCY